MGFKKYEKSADSEAMQVSELPPPPQYRNAFALCLIKSRYLMLSGGIKQEITKCSEVWLFDTESGEWMASSTYPDLKTARYYHSSCASQSAAFVYGGFDVRINFLNDVEYLRLEEQRDWFGQVKQPEWKSFALKELKARSSAVMATISPNSIMIYGGTNNGSLSDGALVDTNQKKVV